MDGNGTTTSTLAILVGLTLLSLASMPAAQAAYFEGFESAGSTASGQHGPDGLLAAGWEFRNQSQPLSSGDWHRSAWAYQGSWSLYVDTSVGFWQDDRSEVSTWALLPSIPGQSADDEIRFLYTCGSAPPLVPSAHLEVRYSPTGGTSTGSGPGDVGDFSVLLFDVPDLQDPWTELRATVPGGGRLAFRFHIPPAPSQPSFWGDFSIDDLTVGPAFVGIPLPQPGETVHWTSAMSPIDVTQVSTIPAGGTVVVDPGVVVHVGAQLTVEGRLLAGGVPGTPVRFDGAGHVLVPGELAFDEVVVDCLIQPEDGGTLTFTHASFEAGGPLTTVASPTYIWRDPAFVSVERCTFDGTYLRVANSNVAVRSTTFAGSFCAPEGYVYLDDVTIDGSPSQGLYLLGFEQPFFLDKVTITNATGAGIDLVAANLQIGGNVILAGNLYPLQLGGAGLLPGSTLPAAGNSNNFVRVASAWAAARAGQTWSDVGIPYVIDTLYFGSFTEVLPGVNIRLGPGASLWGDSGGLNLRGTPDDPVVVERFDPQQAWQGLQYLRRLENCIVDGGDIGARFHSSGGTPGYLDNCIIRNCTYGSQNWAVARKTRFVDNTVGSWNDYWTDSLDGAAGANSFEGNVLAVDANGRLVDAPNDWWGDPSGPRSADNPEGHGQTATVGVRTVPFLTAPPDFTDSPPIVHLNEHSWLLEAGEKVILTWSAEDDRGIASQRIEFDHPLDGRQVVAGDLPGSARAYEWTVPDIGFAVNCAAPEIRVVAIDAAGQEGWDASEHLIPSGEVQGTLVLDDPPTGTFLAGSELPPLCWTPVGTNPLGGGVTGALQFDADGTSSGLGGASSNCLAAPTEMPFISTDTARVRLALQDGSCNRVKYVFSDYFEIRPDTRLGDAPPSVELLSPQAGDVHAGGSGLYVSWDASDDEGLRAFHVQASYDGGRTWHFVARDLPGSARSWIFRLPPSRGIADVRIRIIAVDLRFQNSSDGTYRAFSIAPGPSKGDDRQRTGKRRRP